MASGHKSASAVSSHKVDKSEAVLIGLLSVLDSAAPRTKLVNLTYLLDNLSLNQNGWAMTEFTYRSGEYGPSAGNSIVDRLSDLSERGVAREIRGATPLGDSARYRIREDFDKAKLPLDSDEWALIHSVVHTYGTLGVSEILKESKKAMIAWNGRQSEDLGSISNSERGSTKADSEDIEFDRMIREALSDRAERISIEELRRQVEKSSDF